MRVRAPKGGYDFPAKADYREQIWKTFAKHVADPATAQVAFLPGSEGLEIPVALRYGFRLENLHAIEDDPDVVMQWRDQYPTVNFYRKRTSRAFREIKRREISLDAANLDYCSNISTSLFSEIDKVKHANALRSNAVVAVTLLRGREQHDTSAALSIMSGYAPEEFEDPRLFHIAKVLFPPSSKLKIKIHAQGYYQSTSPMGWIVVGHEEVDAKLQRFFVPAKFPIVPGVPDFRRSLDATLLRSLRGK